MPLLNFSPSVFLYIKIIKFKKEAKMKGIETVVFIVALVAVFGALGGVFASLLGHLLDED